MPTFFCSVGTSLGAFLLLSILVEIPVNVYAARVALR